MLLTNSMEQSPPWRATSPQLVRKFLTLYGSQRFIPAFASLHHLSPFWARPIQSMTFKPTSWSFMLILSSHLHLGLPSGLIASGFPTKTLMAPAVSHTCHMSCSSHSWLDDLNNILWVQVIKLHSPVALAVVGPNIFLSTLSLNTLSLYSYINVRDQVLHPYQTTGKITVLCILISVLFFDGKAADKTFCTESICITDTA